jgi:hypothetical protein
MSLYRYDPPLGSRLPGAPVRPAGVAGPVVCQTCGCRLEAPARWAEDEAESDGAWRHFSVGHAGRDARGCTVGCVELDHSPDGSVIG